MGFHDMQLRAATDGGWKKASRCSSSTCVEVLVGREYVLLRDTKQSALGVMQPILSIPADRWLEVLTCWSKGQTTDRALVSTQDDADGVRLRSPDGTIQLAFDWDEWTTYVSGVRDGEFNLHSAARPNVALVD